MLDYGEEYITPRVDAMHSGIFAIGSPGRGPTSLVRSQIMSNEETFLAGIFIHSAEMLARNEWGQLWSTSILSELVDSITASRSCKTIVDE